MELSGRKVLLFFMAVLAIIVLACIGKIGEDVKNDQIVVNQFPFTGEMAYWTQPGLKGQWFGHVTRYQKTNQVWFDQITLNEDGSLSTHGLNNPALPITYSDKIIL